MLHLLCQQAPDCSSTERSLPWQVWKTLVQKEGARSLFKGAMYPVTTIAMQVWFGHAAILSRCPLDLLSCSVAAVPQPACFLCKAHCSTAARPCLPRYQPSEICCKAAAMLPIIPFVQS